MILRRLIRIFSEAKKINHAVLVHVITKKGKGYTSGGEESVGISRSGTI